MCKLKVIVNLVKLCFIVCVIYQNVLNISEVGALDYMKTAKTPFVTTIKHIRKNSQKVYKFEQSAVIFCNDLEDIREFNEKAKLSNKYPKKLKFLVICEKSIDRKFPKPHELLWKEGTILEFQYFFTNKAGSIDLQTYEWFLEGKCNKPQLTLLNSFSKTTLKWKNHLAIKDKFMNFNQCPINLLIGETRGLQACMKNGELTSFQLDIFKILSYKGNFRMNFSFLGDRSRYHSSPFFRDKTQLILRDQTYSIFNIDNVHIPKMHAEMVGGLVIPPTESYTIYEKLFMPFDELTWIFLIVTFGFAFGFIFVIKRYAPIWVQNLIYGEGVRMPAFNVIGTFFGIGQVRLPVSNFPRIILMTFILFCLVIRTAYQGVFYEMMTHDLKRPLPKTIDDLYKENYTIAAYPLMRQLLETMIDSSRRPKIDTENAKRYMHDLKNGIIAKKVVFLTVVNIKPSVEELMNCGLVGALEETLGVDPIGFALKRNHFMIYLIEEVIDHLLSAGIIQNSRENHYVLCQSPYYPSEHEPYVFALQDLSFGFYIWLVTVGVALLVLALELTWFYGKRTTKRIVRASTALYFILKRLHRGFGL